MIIILLTLLVPSAYAAMCNGPLSDDERNGFLNAHNALRSSIALGTFTAQGSRKPAAGNMQALTWDCTIEASAQRYANTCPTDHSHWPGLGENLYWSYSTVPISPAGIGAKASNSWAQEFQTYGMNSLVYNGERTIGHATQMAWAETNKIGCAYMNNCPSSNARFQYEIAVVCQYVIPGNMRTMPIYSAMPTCSQCPTGTTCNQATGLCQAGAAPPPAAPPAPPVVAPTAPPPAGPKPVAPPAAPATAKPVAPPVKPPPQSQNPVGPAPKPSTKTPSSEYVYYYYYY